MTDVLDDALRLGYDTHPETLRGYLMERGYVLVRIDTGGVLEDGTTNDPPIDFEKGPWDPHAVNFEHPCIVCGKISSHDHSTEEFAEALKNQ